MANSPTDRDSEQMFAEHGTKCLITDKIADKYLDRAQKEKGQHSRWCGGKGGWDNYLERWH